ncbi:MAG: phosphoglucosamine mutase [Clostridia bacterium]|nr:phosphoglucosamine mutase [Clostridia bacterium]
MGVFFGTDGLRGIVGEELSCDLAYRVGNALSSLTPKRVLIGRDTRISGEYLTMAISLGLMSGGVDVVDVGVCPTAGVAYLTRQGYDYGIVVSASHNPKEYNGIKIFDRHGYKLSDAKESEVERYFVRPNVVPASEIGRYSREYQLVDEYEDYLVSIGERLDGIKVVLDCANGASSRIAPRVFERLGASVEAYYHDLESGDINEGCGALYPDTIKGKMSTDTDVGYCFDGDSDRLITISKDGELIDGDMMIYYIGTALKREGLLKDDTVVGTSHTNMGIEKALEREGIRLIRTDIGDKYVLRKLVEKSLSIGGEQSGHIILKDLATTGDGILTAIVFGSIVKRGYESISHLLYPQTNLNVRVVDKWRVINSEELSSQVARASRMLEGRGRVMVRASGTEEKIRVMVESEDSALNDTLAKDIEKVINTINAL